MHIISGACWKLLGNWRNTPPISGQSFPFLKFWVSFAHRKHIKVCTTKKHIRIRFQLLQPLIGGLSETENVLHYVKSKLNLAAVTGFLVFHILEPASTLALCPCVIAVRLLLVCAELYLGKMFIILDLGMVFKCAVWRIAVYNFVILPQQLVCRRCIVNIGRRDYYSMNQTASSIYSGMELRPEVLLIAFLCLVHLGISAIICVLGGFGRINDGRVFNPTAMHHLPMFFHEPLYRFKVLLCDTVLNDYLPELA